MSLTFQTECRISISLCKDGHMNKAPPIRNDDTAIRNYHYVELNNQSHHAHTLRGLI